MSVRPCVLRVRALRPELGNTEPDDLEIDLMNSTSHSWASSRSQDETKPEQAVLMENEDQTKSWSEPAALLRNHLAHSVTLGGPAVHHGDETPAVCPQVIHLKLVVNMQMRCTCIPSV